MVDLELLAAVVDGVTLWLGVMLEWDSRYGVAVTSYCYGELGRNPEMEIKNGFKKLANDN